MRSPDPLFPSGMEIAFEGYDPDDERRRESLFALGNGLLFIRAAPCEAAADDTHHTPGTYRAGCYSRRHRTTGNGRTIGHDDLVNLPNGLGLTFRIADGTGEWLSLRDQQVLDYRHVLNLAAGITERHALVRDGHGRCTRLCERRLVSMASPKLAAIQWTIIPENWSGPIEIRSTLDGDVRNDNTDHGMLPAWRHLVPETGARDQDGRLALGMRTGQSGISVHIAARTGASTEMQRRTSLGAACAAEYLSGTARQGRTLTIEKVLAVATSRDPATSDPAEAAHMIVAEAAGFHALAQDHARAWQRLWRQVGIDAAQAELQRAVVFHVFHLLQTTSPHSVQLDVGLPSRGWQEAYHGQIFWDEIFAYSFLNHRFPELARSLLLYRYRRLPAARRAARQAGYEGAMYPWRSASTGAEETPGYQFNPLSGRFLPDDTRLQRHIGAAIAHNIWHHVQATGDMSFLYEYGAEMLIEIARFWASIAQHDPADDRFDICGVIGPDEYHNAYPGAAAPGLNNNAYTNVMASVTLRHAARALEQLPRHHRSQLEQALCIGPAEPARWMRIARRLRLCFHGDGIISQFDGFDRLQPFDRDAFAAAHPHERVDRVLEAHGDTVDAYQVTKQADVLMLLHLFQPEELARLINDMGYATDVPALRRTTAYYLDRISHESSLSRIVCAGALARFDPGQSWTFFQRAMCIDLDPANSTNAEEGLHLGAMAGMLDVLQRHYLGLHIHDDAVRLDPAPPPALGPVRMRLQHRDGLLHLHWDGEAVLIQADAANPSPLPVLHGGKRHQLTPGGNLKVAPAKVAATKTMRTPGALPSQPDLAQPGLT